MRGSAKGLCKTIYPWSAVEGSGGRTASEDDLINSLVKGTKTMLSSETLLVDAIQDLVRDEIKKHIRQKIEDDPELKKELAAAIKMLMDAKIHEAIAVLKLAKGGAKLGLSMVPPDLRKEMGQELVTMFEREVNQMLSQE
ncbi:MAG: hypothetical protein JSU93_01865 [Methanobacteriota archaeon]|nr:MAG: hypothetical protein JSU93_01865 [Euryarchaeota archaeon]